MTTDPTTVVPIVTVPIVTVRRASGWLRRAAAGIGVASAVVALALVIAPAPVAAVPLPGARLAAPGPAAAAPVPGTGLAAAQKVTGARIDLRLATLSALTTAIGAATNLTSADRSTLTGIISTDTSGLTALKGTVNGETTVAGVKADARSMVVDYRIYMLVVPQTRFAIAGDRETATITALTSVHDKLAALAASLAGQGKDTSAAQAKIDDMTTQLTAATSALGDQPETLLAVKPSTDATAMKAAVSPVRSAVRTARADIATALADAKAARAALAG